MIVDIIYNSVDFYIFVKNELEQQLEEAKENIYNRIDNSNNIKLYRAMTVDDNWLLHLKTQGKRIGIFWSWDEEYAEAHWVDTSKKNVKRRGGSGN